jgi:hypothetical protein
MHTAGSHGPRRLTGFNLHAAPFTAMAWMQWASCSSSSDEDEDEDDPSSSSSDDSNEASSASSVLLLRTIQMGHPGRVQVTRLAIGLYSGLRIQPD